MIFSVGYAGKSIAVFIEHLKRHNIQVLIDVRSAPGSRAFPGFNRAQLCASLDKAGISYRWAGDVLGPRSSHPEHYNSQGQVQFDRLRESSEFGRAIESVVEVAATQNAACMCAEKFAETCHRSLLIGEDLLARGVQMHHISFDGALESQAQMRQRLSANQGGMFPDEDLAIEDQISRHAYRKSAEADPYEPA